MKKYIVAAMVGLFIGSVVGIAGAKEPRKGYAPPALSGASCKQVRDIGYTVDGSLVIRSAWRCERNTPNKPVYGKLVTR